MQMRTQNVVENVVEEDARFRDDRTHLLSPAEILDLPCRVEEKLLRWYLIGDYLPPPPVPLHLRRTLDQAYYTKLDTRARDNDQVIFRYTRDVTKLGQNAMMIMVDQCWLWVVRKSPCTSN